MSESKITVMLRGASFIIGKPKVKTMRWLEENPMETPADGVNSTGDGVSNPGFSWVIGLLGATIGVDLEWMDECDYDEVSDAVVELKDHWTSMGFFARKAPPQESAENKALDTGDSLTESPQDTVGQ